MDFAVQLPDEEIGRWVLFVDPVKGKFLIVKDDKTFQWVAITECRLFKATTPDLPLPVVMVKPNQKIEVPTIRGHMSRNSPDVNGR